MSDKETPCFPERKNQRLCSTALFMAILAVWALFAGWTVQRADREIRADLLIQTRMVVQLINFERVKALAGTADDLDSAHYRRIKEQLTAVRLANPQCRFLYLMGRKFDGTIFFFVDSERADSKDYSPPGQKLPEASKEFRRMFDTKTELVEGPVTDRWGVWISTLIPLTDPQTGAMIAVLGMDIDARTWKRNVAARAALPAGLLLVLLIGVFAVCRLLPR